MIDTNSMKNSKNAAKRKISLRLLGVLFVVLPVIFVFAQYQRQRQIHAAATDTSTNVPAGISPGNGFEDSFQNMGETQQKGVISQMKNDGVQWLRLDCYYNSSYDYQFITDAEAAGIHVDALLEDFNATPEEFAKFGTQAVTNLEPLGVHTYEILNEVNAYQDPINKSTITAAKYVPMLKAAYTAIKHDDPSSTVLMSGLSTGSSPNSQDQPDTYLKAMYAAGAKPYFDAANMHPYSFPDMPAPSDCQNYNGFCHDLPAMHDVMQQNQDSNKKIWLTEFGCPTGPTPSQKQSCTEEQLGQQITQAFQQARTWEWTGPLFVFSWEDNTENGDLGLYRTDGSSKDGALIPFKRTAQGA